MHLVVVAWGITAILGKLIDLPAVDVTIWRTGIAVVVFAVLAPWLARHDGGTRVSAAEMWRYAGIGALLGIHWVLFFWSARLSTASVCLAVLPTGMIWCTLIEPLVDGTRKWRLLELVVGLVMIGAAWIIYRVEIEHWRGFWVAVVAAFVAALFATASKQVVSQRHWTVIGTHQMAGAFAASLLCRPLLESGWVPDCPRGPSIWWMVILSLVCTVAAYGGLIHALRRMSVFSMNVIYNLEPVYGIVLAAAVFGDAEVMSGGFYLGAAIIIASVVSLPWLRKAVEVSP